MMHPNSKFKTTWDTTIICLVIYSAVTVPFNIAFLLDGDIDTCQGDNQPEICPPGGLFYLDILVDIMFWVSVCGARENPPQFQFSIDLNHLNVYTIQRKQNFPLRILQFRLDSSP